jgi:hypothetical protein
LGQKFYNDATQETQWWGAPNHTEPQPHPLAKIAWNNLNLSNCCLQIDDEKKVIKEIIDKIKKCLPMSLCRPERDKVPMTYCGLVLNPRWV